MYEKVFLIILFFAKNLEIPTIKKNPAIVAIKYPKKELYVFDTGETYNLFLYKIERIITEKAKETRLIGSFCSNFLNCIPR